MKSVSPLVAQIALNSTNCKYEWTARKVSIIRLTRTHCRSTDFTNIPKCIISRLMQRCTNSDTMQLAQQPLLSCQPFRLPSLSRHLAFKSSPADTIPTSRDYSRFYPRKVRRSYQSWFCERMTARSSVCVFSL